MRAFLLLAMLATPPPLPAPPAPDYRLDRPLTISYDPQAGYRPVLRVGPVLDRAELEDAALSGVPIRVRIRVELWRDRFFDQLVETADWASVIVYEPIGEQFFVRTMAEAGRARRADTFAAARGLLERVYTPAMRPRERGRYYYTASLQIETLSISDLEELERWLQGELQPAVSGRRSVPRAIGKGARRLLLRLLDVPARRFDTRTGRFDVPR